MAVITWRQNPAVAEALKEGAANFEVEQAVTILEQQQTGCIPLGEGSDPDQEALGGARDFSLQHAKLFLSFQEFFGEI